MAVTKVHAILADAVAGSRDGVTLPEWLCSACVRLLSVTGAGVVLMGSRGFEGLVAATGGLATTMDELQFSLGEGPCVDASQAGRPVLEPQFRRTGPARWPGFGPEALAAGIEAVFAFPLQVGGIRLGVLDLYRDVPGDLSSVELSEALALADAATTILLHLQARTELSGELHPDLEPIQNRAEVHQATGMVAVQAAVGLTEALLLLRGHAYSRERSLLDVARDVVARTLRFPPEDGHHE